MNLDVFFLFFNCALTTLLAAAIVIWILRREYLPLIRELESERGSSCSQASFGKEE